VDLAEEDVRAPDVLDDLVGVHDLELPVLHGQALVHVGHDHLETTRSCHLGVVLEQLDAGNARRTEVRGHAAGELALVRADVEQRAANSLRQLAQDAAAVFLLAQAEDSPEITLRLLGRCASGRRELVRPGTA
jgi:hypothetical protein